MHDMGAIRCSDTDLTNKQSSLASSSDRRPGQSLSHIDRVGFMNR